MLDGIGADPVTATLYTLDKELKRQVIELIQKNSCDSPMAGATTGDEKAREKR